MKIIIFITPGEVEWNEDDHKLTTGYTELSEKGTEEAREAGRIMKMKELQIDVVFTSHEKAAIKTLWLLLEEMDRMWIPVYKSASLNEISSLTDEKDTLEQIILIWDEEIYPSLGLHDTVLVVAPNTTLQILLNELKVLSNANIELPNGAPYVIEFNQGLKIKRNYFIDK